jgi:phosphatidylglycerophosphatase A
MLDDGRWAKRLATWFGCGRAPVAPGTVGSIGALPLAWALSRTSPLFHIGAVLTLTLAGTWAAHAHAEELGDKDPSSVVIDEVVGSLIALGLVRRRGLGAGLFALALFRVLDIAKPGLIDELQSLRPTGLGIMADDVLAGALAGLAVRLLSSAR